MEERAALAKSRTCKGRLYNLIGYFFSVYCIYKMVMAAVNIVFQRVGRTDPVSRGLELLLSHVLNVEIDVRFWSQHASFILVGVIVFTQIRGLLIFMMKLFHAYASAVTSHVFILLLSETMGMYFFIISATHADELTVRVS